MLLKWIRVTFLASIFVIKVDFKKQFQFVMTYFSVRMGKSLYTFFYFISGEIVELSRNGIKSHCIVSPPDAKLPAFCIFEYVYFARPDSILKVREFFIQDTKLFSSVAVLKTSLHSSVVRSLVWPSILYED